MGPDKAYHMLLTNLHKLPVKPESVAATVDGGALDRGSIPEHIS